MKNTLQDLVKNVQSIKTLGCPAQQKALVDLVLGLAKEVLGKDFPEVEAPAADVVDDVQVVDDPAPKVKKKTAKATP